MTKNFFYNLFRLSALVVLFASMTACSPAVKSQPMTYTDNQGYTHFQWPFDIKWNADPADPPAVSAPTQPGNGNSSTDIPSNTTVADACSSSKFVPNLNGLSTDPKSVDEVLKDHNLTLDQVIVVDYPPTPWEPAMTVIEIKPPYKGKITIDLKPGYQYTADVLNDGPTLFMGGDPKCPKVTLNNGTTFRWLATYRANKLGQWLDINNPIELAAREYRHGRYQRTDQLVGKWDVPYFGRTGRYYTKTGNLNIQWVPPALGETVPHSWMDACAMLGGRCVETEWIHSDDMLNWRWMHSLKSANDGKTPANPPEESFYWQSMYVPALSTGYMQIWLEKGATGPGGITVTERGSYKFYAKDLPILLDNYHHVDEATYHADNNK